MKPDLSIVVPLFNEEESALPLWEAIKAALQHEPLSFELVLVDDGSRDRTWEVASSIARSDPRVRAIHFRRNFGQTPAMAAGIDHARGRIIVTMDGDLQNDPRDISRLVAKLEEGYDLAVGWRFNRQDKLISRKIPSRIANWLIGKVTGVPIRDNGCSLKAYRAEVIKSIPLYSEMHRFIPAMSRIAGARIAEMKVRHHARQFGESKYGLSRTWRVLIDLIAIKTLSAAVVAPLPWFARLSLPIWAAGFGLLAAAGREFATRPESLPVVFAGAALVLLSCAILLLFTGVLLDLVIKTGGVGPTSIASPTCRTI